MRLVLVSDLHFVCIFVDAIKSDAINVNALLTLQIDIVRI